MVPWEVGYPGRRPSKAREAVRVKASEQSELERKSNDGGGVVVTPGMRLMCTVYGE